MCRYDMWPWRRRASTYGVARSGEQTRWPAACRTAILGRALSAAPEPDSVILGDAERPCTTQCVTRSPRRKAFRGMGHYPVPLGAPGSAGCSPPGQYWLLRRCALFHVVTRPRVGTVSPQPGATFRHDAAADGGHGRTEQRAEEEHQHVLLSAWGRGLAVEHHHGAEDENGDQQCGHAAGQRAGRQALAQTIA
jgi:hypothetical protein